MNPGKTTVPHLPHWPVVFRYRPDLFLEGLECPPFAPLADGTALDSHGIACTAGSFTAAATFDKEPT